MEVKMFFTSIIHKVFMFLSEWPAHLSLWFWFLRIILTEITQFVCEIFTEITPLVVWEVVCRQWECCFSFVEQCLYQDVTTLALYWAIEHKLNITCHRIYTVTYPLFVEF